MKRARRVIFGYSLEESSSTFSAERENTPTTERYALSPGFSS